MSSIVRPCQPSLSTTIFLCHCSVRQQHPQSTMPYYDEAIHTLPTLSPDELSQWLDVEYRKMVLELVAVSAVAISVWEHMLLMPAELRTWRLLLQGKWMPARAAVLLARYAVIAAIGVTMFFFFGRPSHCHAVFLSIYALYVLLWASCAAIFLMRLSIIYDSDRRVLVPFIGMLVACVAIWCVVMAIGYRSESIATEFQVPHGGKCRPGKIPDWCAISWAAATVYDAAVLIATWVALRKYKKSSSRKSLRTRRWIWSSNLLFFSTSILFNVACLVTELAVRDEILKHLAAPVSFVMHVVVASRLVLDAKGWTSGALAEQEWELDDGATGAKKMSSILPIIGASSGGGDKKRRSSLLQSQSIPFDVTVEERVEYRPSNGGAAPIHHHPAPTVPAVPARSQSRRKTPKDSPRDEGDTEDGRSSTVDEKGSLQLRFAEEASSWQTRSMPSSMTQRGDSQNSLQKSEIVSFNAYATDTPLRRGLRIITRPVSGPAGPRQDSAAAAAEMERGYDNRPSSHSEGIAAARAFALAGEQAENVAESLRASESPDSMTAPYTRSLSTFYSRE